MIKIIRYIFLLLFVFQTGFSQNEKHTSGTVLCNNSPVQGVEVINATTKKMTVTDSQGNFSIGAKAKDLLVFVSKIHDIKQLVLNQQAINKNNLIISLALKAEELNEVLITQIPTIEWKKDTKWEQDHRDQLALEKADRALKVTGVNMGTIEQGMDFVEIGRRVLNWFKKEKEPTKKLVPIAAFKAVASAYYPPDFFSKDLKLKTEEIPLFLEFCDADPKSKIIAESPNELNIMEFLILKNAEFKKL